MSLKALLVTYLIGGLTFLPLLSVVIIYCLCKTLPFYENDKNVNDYDGDDEGLSCFTAVDKDLKLTELEENETTGVKAYKKGWIVVTREYSSVGSTSEKQERGEYADSKASYSALYRLVKTTKKTGKDKEISRDSDSQTGDKQTIKKTVRRKDRYYGVLRHGNLFLYKDDSQSDVQHAIVLSNHIVTIWPRNMTDGSLFTKRSAICILKKEARPKNSSSSTSVNTVFANAVHESTFDILETGIIPPKKMGFFIYPESNFEKEDWYFELIKATKKKDVKLTGTELDLMNPSIYANTLHFKTSDMMNLIETLYSSEGQLQTRWLNALIGRLFLGLQYTKVFEDIVRLKLLKKLAKINKPGFLEDFKVKKIDVGNAAPFISFPKLKELNPDGTLKILVQFTYTGKLSLQVATKANINLGTHFKTREVSLLLAVTINKLEGPLLIMVKPPPSSRVWYTFESEPELDLTIEPVVSHRQITYGVVTKAIENKFREAIKESLVYPYWDDISFFNSSEEFYRGGIWDITKRPDSDLNFGDEGLEEFNLEDTEPEETLDGQSNNTTSTSESNDNCDSSSHKSLSVNTKNSNFSDATSIKGWTSNDDEIIMKESGEVEGDNDSFDSVSFEERRSSRSNTLKTLSSEATASKKSISSSIKKFGKWYNEKTRKNNEKDYAPPEMIQNRRPRIGSSTSSNSTLSMDSEGNIDPPHFKKAAPHAHNFPQEYLYGLQSADCESNIKHVQPSRTEMRSPYLPESSFFQASPTSISSPKKVMFPKRKPVSDDEGLEASEESVSSPVHAAEQSLLSPILKEPYSTETEPLKSGQENKTLELHESAEGSINKEIESSIVDAESAVSSEATVNPLIESNSKSKESVDIQEDGIIDRLKYLDSVPRAKLQEAVKIIPGATPPPLPARDIPTDKLI